MKSGISIIIPTLNEEKVIGHTLRQFLPYRRRVPLEIIVSDDGSTDGTAAAVGGLADTVLFNENGRRGRSGALNRGASRARYDCLLFLDADITIDPIDEFFEEVREAFRQGSGVCGAMADFYVRPADETPADRATHVFWNWVMRGVLAATAIGISTPGFQMGTRSAFDKINGFDERLQLSQDIDYSIRLSRVGGIHYLKRSRILESPRRYRDEGYAIYAWRSFLRWVSVLFRRKSYGEYKCVR